MLAIERFTEEAVAELREAIADAGGNEVFAVGRLDAEGRVAALEIGARGDASSVLALEGYLSRGDIIVHNHPSGFLDPSQADLSIASRAGRDGVGSYIVDNEVGRVYVIAEPVRARALVPIDPDEIAGVLEAGGKLSKAMPGYEPRQGQIELTRAIAEAMNDGAILAAEAGTGIGKSFAYLLPALAWAARNRERVVVSTATINLQRQLADKDIPAVLSLFKKKLKAVVVKGRGNYLCRNRLAEAIDEEGLFAGAEHPLRAIEAWAAQSSTGDRADLSFWPDDALWSRVRSEADECLNMRCPFRETCFVLLAKRDAADADLIVANHHILMSDLSARSDGAGYESSAVLPPYTTVIFDEAHAIESSATSLFTEELTRFSVQRQVSRLYRERRGRKFGIMLKLQNIKGLPTGLLDRFQTAAEALRDAMDQADAKALAALGGEPALRLIPANGEASAAILGTLSTLERSLLAIAELLDDAIETLPEESRSEQAVQEAGLALARVSALASICSKYARFEDDAESVYWIERATTSQGEAFARWNVSPLEIAGIMNESVFEPFRSVTCVSATLSAGGSFEFWKRRVGIRASSKPAVCAEFRSPFPYSSRVLFASPTDAPAPDSPGWQAWLSDAVYGLIEASGGRALVLFTSYSTLRATWDSVKPRLEALGIAAYRQGDDERSRLMAAFKADVSSVLFATDSFREGVDAPGETLELVIMAKLPFRVPTDPVQKARAEAVEARGGNSFADLSLPDAAIRFKQGFGRLMRRSDDRGAVAVLDSRLLGKRYGEVFVNSVPKTKTSWKPLSAMIEDVRDFIGRT